MPDDLLHIQASPSSFGGLIGQGAEQFGAGAFKASQNFGQIVADDSSNQYQEQVNKILHGDPTKTVIGPDGQPTQDMGYLGLHGRAALDARPQVESQMDQLAQSIRSKLATPEQQLEFDNFSRRYRTVVSSQIGTHAETQANVYAVGVNKATADNTLTHITNNPNDDQIFQHGVEDLKGAYVRNSQLAGGGPQAATDAVSRATADAWRARIQTIAVKEPMRAAQMADQHQTELGAEYPGLAESLRGRSQQQQGYTVGASALASSRAKFSYNSPALPVFAQASSSVPGGYSSAGLSRTIQIESHGNPTASNGHMVGLGQFSPTTWAQFGEGDRTDPQQAILATQRYAAANRPVLTSALGREPTDAELYLAHQQGPGGAVALLTHPNMSAVDVLTPIYHGNRALAATAIRGNGGDPNAPASAFTSLWTGRFNGGPGVASIAPAGGQTMTMPEGTQGTAAPVSLPAAEEPLLSIPEAPPALASEVPGVTAPQAPIVPQQRLQAPTEGIRADAYSAIINNPDLSPEVKQHALAYISQTYQAQQIAELGDTKAKKDANDQAAGQYVSKILTGNTSGLLEQIASDPHLTWETKRTLGDALLHSASGEEMGAIRSYGPGFWQAYKAVTAPVNDPSYIGDVNAILRRAAPGGDLSMAGAQKLITVMHENQRSVNDQAVSRARVGLLSYAKSKLSFQDDTGFVKIRDPKGEAIFNAQFIPKFEAAYDQWIQKGKDPWDFLTQDNIDKMLKGMRSQSQMAQDKLAASGEAPAGGSPALPPAPQNVDQAGWNKIMSAPLSTTNGAPFPKAAFAQAVQMLIAQPTPENIRLFDQSKFGRAGFRAEDIVQQLKPQHQAQQ
jgi:hypothetical protein